MSNERDRMLDMITEMSNKNAEKDQRIAELEKEVKVLEEIAKTNKTAVSNKILRQLEATQKENAKLKANAIVPKFKVGDEIWAVVSYITESEDDIYNNVIETGIIQKIEIYKRKLEYWCDNGRIYWQDKFVKLFATKEEAQQKLKELEGEK